VQSGLVCACVCVKAQIPHRKMGGWAFFMVGNAGWICQAAS